MQRLGAIAAPRSLRVFILLIVEPCADPGFGEQSCMQERQGALGGGERSTGIQTRGLRIQGTGRRRQDLRPGNEEARSGMVQSGSPSARSRGVATVQVSPFSCAIS